LAIWDLEEDRKIYKHFKDQLPDKAKVMKKKADRGFTQDDQIEVVDATGDSSGFEDVDSDEEDTRDAEVIKKSKSSKKTK
jgi:hypothetical protein